jgi:hypothetical protein
MCSPQPVFGLPYSNHLLLGKNGSDSGSDSGNAFDLELAAQDHSPLSHPEDTHAGRAVGICAPPIVSDLNGKLAAGS